MNAIVSVPVSAPDEVIQARCELPTMEELIVMYARQLVRDGWCRGVACRYTDNGDLLYCTVGAFNQAAHSLHASEKSLQNAFGAFCAVNRLNPVKVWKWNDRFWRTKASVLRAFDRALVAA